MTDPMTPRALPEEAVAPRHTFDPETCFCVDARIHEDDSYGACVICREWVPHTDDEYRGVAFPCAPARLAAAEQALSRHAPDGAVAVDGATVERRAICSQCGQPWAAWACGPTHAVVREELGIPGAGGEGDGDG